jgi:hypothetical protein
MIEQSVSPLNNQDWNQPGGIQLPLDPFDVVIHRDRQAVTTPQSPALQNFAPVRGRHTLSKTVHPQSSMDFRLISPLWHASSFQI